MKLLTVVLTYSTQPWFKNVIKQFQDLSAVYKIIILHNSVLNEQYQKCEIIKSDNIFSSNTINYFYSKIETRYLLIISQANEIKFGHNSVLRMLRIAEDTGAGIVYSDYLDAKEGQLIEHPLNDYQLGSVRDNFDFGPVLMLSMKAVKKSINKFGGLRNSRCTAFYDLRLKISVEHLIFHVKEFLYSRWDNLPGKESEEQFGYVDPRNRKIQLENEAAVTSHLKHINAYLKPKFNKPRKSNLEFMRSALFLPFLGVHSL